MKGCLVELIVLVNQITAAQTTAALSQQLLHNRVYDFLKINMKTKPCMILSCGKVTYDGYNFFSSSKIIHNTYTQLGSEYNGIINTNPAYLTLILKPIQPNCSGGY